jgi:hypothetical protein
MAGKYCKAEFTECSPGECKFPSFTLLFACVGNSCIERLSAKASLCRELGKFHRYFSIQSQGTFQISVWFKSRIPSVSFLYFSLCSMLTRINLYHFETLTPWRKQVSSAQLNCKSNISKISQIVLTWAVRLIQFPSIPHSWAALIKSWTKKKSSGKRSSQNALRRSGNLIISQAPRSILSPIPLCKYVSKDWLAVDGIIIGKTKRVVMSGLGLCTRNSGGVHSVYLIGQRWLNK